MKPYKRTESRELLLPDWYDDFTLPLPIPFPHFPFPWRRAAR